MPGRLAFDLTRIQDNPTDSGNEAGAAMDALPSTQPSDAGESDSSSSSEAQPLEQTEPASSADTLQPDDAPESAPEPDAPTPEEPAADAADEAAEQDPAADAIEGAVDGDAAEAADGELPEADAEEGLAEGAELSGGFDFAPLMDLIEAGGPIIVLLAALSVASIALIIIKYAQFRLQRVAARGFVDTVVGQVRRGKIDDALRLLSRRKGPLARVMEAAVRGKKLPANQEGRVREEVTRVAQSKLDTLEFGLPFLSLIATVSPLLGLLGTVLGMIDAFQQLENAGDRVDPAILSGGIWEALLTTAAGLSVAIPAAAFYTWLQRTVDVTAQRMEDAATQVFTADLYDAAPQPSDDD